jgi:NAD+--asparagine ADP-ribosyltransferase
MFAALSRRHAIDFVRRFNATNPSIQLEAVTYELSGIFLDLDVSLVPSSRAGYSVFKHTIYQKPIYTNMIMIKNFVVKNTRYGLNQTSKFPDEIKSDINFSKRDTGNKTGSLKSGIET